MNIIYVFLLFLPIILNNFEKFKNVFSAQYNKDNIEYTNKKYLNTLNEDIHEYNSRVNLNSLLEILDFKKYIKYPIIDKNINLFKKYIRTNGLMNTIKCTIQKISSTRVSRQLYKQHENNENLGINKRKAKINEDDLTDFNENSKKQLEKEQNFSNSEYQDDGMEDFENDMKEDSEYYDDYEHYIEEEYDDTNFNNSYKSEIDNIPRNRIANVRIHDNKKSDVLDSFLEKEAYNDTHSTMYEDDAYYNGGNIDYLDSISFLEKGKFDGNHYDEKYEDGEEDNYDDYDYEDTYEDIYDEHYKNNIVSFLEKRKFDDNYYEENDEYGDNSEYEYDEDNYEGHNEKDQYYEENFFDENNDHEYANYEYGDNALNDDLHSKKKRASNYDQNSYTASHLPPSKKKSNLNDDSFDNHHLNQINQAENVYSFIQPDIENVNNLLEEHANMKNILENDKKLSVRKLMNKKNEVLDYNELESPLKISELSNQNNESVYKDNSMFNNKDKQNKNLTDEEITDNLLEQDEFILGDDDINWDNHESKLDKNYETDKFPEVTEAMEHISESNKIPEIPKTLESSKISEMIQNREKNVTLGTPEIPLASENSDLEEFSEFSSENQESLEIPEELSETLVKKEIGDVDTDNTNYVADLDGENDNILKKTPEDDNFDEKLTDQGIIEETLLLDNENDDIKDKDGENNDYENTHENNLYQSANNLVNTNFKSVYNIKKLRHILPHENHLKNEKSDNENEEFLDFENEESLNAPVVIETEENEIIRDKDTNKTKSRSSVSVLSYLLIFLLPIYIKFINA